MNAFAQAEHQYLTPPEPVEHHGHTDVVCPLADCPNVEPCITCDVDLCTEHSNEFTTCTDGGLHHDDCANDCPACDAGRAEDAAHERADAIRKGE